MKRTFSLVLALAMLVLSGCAAKTGGGDRTPEELTDRYAQAITQYGGEMVEYNPVVSEYNEENAMYLELLGLTQEDMTAFALSVSMMNVKAYGIAAVMPAPGKEEAVREALQGFIDTQKMSFEFYLADQYEIAQNARLETLSDGTVLMVMTQDQDAVYQAIAQALEG